MPTLGPFTLLNFLYYYAIYVIINSVFPSDEFFFYIYTYSTINNLLFSEIVAVLHFRLLKHLELFRYKRIHRLLIGNLSVFRPHTAQFISDVH